MAKVEHDIVILSANQMQHDLLINEIESTDGHLATALRSVYESESSNKFLERLESRIETHNTEIERMCSFHYQGFIDSVHSLLQVRSDVDHLKMEIQIVNKDLQLSGKSLLDKGMELSKNRQIQKNIEIAIETLTMLLPVLETYSRLKEQMTSKRFYAALKTFEQLEHVYLPRVNRYRFSTIISDAIPRLREEIKMASMNDLKDFLESIRKHSSHIGEVAVRQVAQENNMDPPTPRMNPLKRAAPLPPNQQILNGPRVNPFGEDMEEEVSAQDLLDFSPVYRCLHIYSVLGIKEEFESYYRKQRRKQASLALQLSASMENIGKPNYPVLSESETMNGYKSFFNEIVGFFVVEEHILHTTVGLINQAYLDELWEMALQRITAILRSHIGNCTDVSLLLRIKNLLMLFCLTLRGYGYSVSQLFELLLELRDQYSEILRKQWVGIFNKIFDEDDYTPIYVENLDQYQRIIDEYPFRDDILEQLPFPKRFPFSRFVPAIFIEVKKYISVCIQFSEDLNLSISERCQMVNVSVDKILKKTLIGCINLLIKKPHWNLIQLIQISINMEYLDQSCVYLEDFISQVSGTHHENLHSSKLHGQSMFKSVKSEAESEIYREINLKIEEFFDLSSYDWMMVEPNHEPSEYIVDMIAFLKSIFKSFTNLPEKVAQTACMSACKHISEKMIYFLKDPDVKSITEALLCQFSLDLQQCEKFAEENSVGGLDGKVYKLAFADLRQILNLFTSWEWAIFFADYGKNQSAFVRVNPSLCIVILEKLKESDRKKGNLFAPFKRNDKDKKKLVHTILKQLRQLVIDQRN